MSYRSEPFKQLQREWYERLKQTGFKDIETSKGQIKADIHSSTRRRAIGEYHSRSSYFNLALHFFHDFGFSCDTHRLIWERHAYGESVRETAVTLSISRGQVWRVLKKLLPKFKVKCMDQIKIRNAKESDRDFIFSSWLKNYKATSEFAKRIKNDIYFSWHHKIIESIIIRPTTEILVATLPDEEDVIIGYIVFEPFHPVIHYCLIKQEWQKLGIATALLKAAKLESPITFTHWTNPVDSLINKKSVHLVYDPYRI